MGNGNVVKQNRINDYGQIVRKLTNRYLIESFL